jgi:hypothetical protein
MREEGIAPDAALLEDVGSVYRTAGAAASSF